MEGRKCKYQTQAVAGASSSPPWIDLPRDITADILQRLGADDLLCSAQQVCSSWWRICQEPALWRVLYFSNPLRRKSLSDYDLMLRRAVDRSQGQLIDLTVHYFGSANLMIYIARRSPNLKRLKLGICFHISGFHAAQIFAKLPHLEELHLTLDRAVDIRSIGYACPTLKSFSLNTFNCKFVLLEGADGAISFYRNLCARAIAESMPNLQHLQLFAHWIGNQGLEDILEACPRLESLDVRRCFDLHLEGDLGKRCRERMKHLKLPHDSVSDVPWPKWDGRDPFGRDAYFYDCAYDYYRDGEDYFESEDDEDDEDENVDY